MTGANALRRVPVVATLVVLAAVAVMVRLGFWQLDRMHQKEAMLARYQAGSTMSAEVPFPQNGTAAQDVLYRRSSVVCQRVVESTTIAGRNDKDEPGLAVVAKCDTAQGARVTVVLGWSREPPMRQPWQKGLVRGTIAPGPRLVADPPQWDLQPNAKPDPRDIPNNHLSYAVQWFLFALTALAIYGLALRKRLRG